MIGIWKTSNNFYRVSQLNEIKEVYKIAKKSGCKQLIVLYCVSSYPAKNEDFNLNNISILKKKFKCEIGFSDHSTDNKVAESAVAMGAEIIEKHKSKKVQKSGGENGEYFGEKFVEDISVTIGNQPCHIQLLSLNQ